MAIDLLLLIGLTISAVGSILKRDMVKAAIALALTSVILSVLMFRFSSPLAAVFELSVCASLITVLFMSTISLTKPLTKEKEEKRMPVRAWHIVVLPTLLIVAALLLTFVKIPMDFTAPPAVPSDVRSVLWNNRQPDLLGQILVIIAGFFGVLVLFKERLFRADRAEVWTQPVRSMSVLTPKESDAVGINSVEVREGTNLGEPLSRKS